MTRTGLTKHLSSCVHRQEAIAASDAKRGSAQALYHLLVQDAWGGDFWLHLEMNGSAQLADLDHYLRAIWLECCGHLSEFLAGSRRGREISSKLRADQVFASQRELTHIYDFGTSSETLIKCVSVRQGKPLTTHPIVLMARNNIPEVFCMECGRAASLLCLECMYEHDESGMLCAQHAKTHPHDDYGEPIALVNSPRLGMCGYTGPAEPPY
jgi:hypothetical protein